MKETRLLMGMPITVEIVDPGGSSTDLNAVFDYFVYVDEKFSTYKERSEVSQINSGLLGPKDYSLDLSAVLALCEETKKETNGFFDILHKGKIDPSGLVKGWAIYNAAKLLWQKGKKNFYIDAGGDIQVSGKNSQGDVWTVGIRNPLSPAQNVKILHVNNLGVATSGTYERGNHIYNPFNSSQKDFDVVSLTVVGPNIYEADRFATAAFAMGRKGIEFISSLAGFEGYQIDWSGQATFTGGFNKFVA